MTYDVTFKVEARFEASVDADSIEEAMQKAQGRFADADFGETVDIEGEPIIIEDENGDYLWEK